MPSDRNWDFLVKLMILIIFQVKGIQGYIIKILEAGVYPQLGGGQRLPLDEGFGQFQVPVVDVGVGDDVDQFSGLIAAGSGQGDDQKAVLHHVPVGGGEHVLAALVQNGVQPVAADIEGHGVGTGVEAHLAQVVVVVEVGHNAAAGRVVLQLPDYPIHLIHIALRVVVLHPQLIAVGLADSALVVSPGIPYVAAQLVNVVGFLLPDPQQLIQSGLPIGAANGENGELLGQIVAVDYAEFVDGVGRGAVLPAGPDLLVGVPDALGQNVLAVLNKYLIGVAHGLISLSVF